MMRIDPETKPGRLLLAGVKGLLPGTHYQYTSRGHRLIVSAESPDPGTVAAVQTGSARFGLFEQNEIFLFLAQFGAGPCTVAHYNWWFNPPHRRPDPFTELAQTDPRINLLAVVADAADGVVAAAHTFELDAHFSRTLLELVTAQIQRDFDPGRHLDVVREVLCRYPNRRAMLRQAVSVCSFGMPSGVLRGKEEEARAAGRPAERRWAVPGPS